MTVRVRRARVDDAAAVAAFTRDTWPDRAVDDYVPRAFERWVESGGPDRRAFVAEVDGDVAGVVQGTMLSPWEAWAQGLRIDPAHRGAGLGTRLTTAVFEWARGRGAATVRNLVFSWNAPSLGLSRTVGFEPCTEFRWATPAPDAAADPAMRVVDDGDDAWAFWTDSAARDHLRGLALDGDEPWALSELTRADVLAAADADRLVAVADGGVRGVALRTRVRAYGDGDPCAEYAVGAWAPGDGAAARSLLSAVARDAAAVDAAATRVLVPETCAWVTDVAAARAGPAEHPDFVLAADLTDPAWSGEERDGGNPPTEGTYATVKDGRP
jgi:GNAT superfamily N-acetyltransferase